MRFTFIKKEDDGWHFAGYVTLDGAAAKNDVHDDRLHAYLDKLIAKGLSFTKLIGRQADGAFVEIPTDIGPDDPEFAAQFQERLPAKYGILEAFSAKLKVHGLPAARNVA